jgi:ABC-type glycerol-3-phosphate transport system substrate-binding protein
MLLAITAGACGGGGNEATTPPPPEPATGGGEPATPPAAGEWSLATAAEPYKGSTITVLEELTDLQPSFAEVIPQFEAETGITVDYRTEGHADVIQKGEADLFAGRGEYDLVMVHDFQQGRVVDADVIEPIQQYLDNPALKDPNVNFSDFIQGPTTASLNYGGQQLCFPSWIYNLVYWVRKDFLENPDEQAAFEQKYGYPLALPQTMDQMTDIAEFFTREAGDTLAGETLDQPMYGFVQEEARLGTTWHSLYWIYLRQFGGGLFDEESGQPNVVRPENVQALDFFNSLQAYSPPGATEFSLIDIPVVMGEGRAASGLVFSDFVFSVDTPGGSPYAGQFLYAAPPMVGDGAYRVTQTTPACEVINKASDNKEAAFLFVQWAASKQAQDAWFAQEKAAMPVRTDSFDLPAFTSGPYAAMYSAAKAALEQGSGFTQIPKLFEISDSINLELQKLLTGGQTSQETVESIQRSMEEICGGQSCFAAEAKTMP